MRVARIGNLYQPVPAVEYGGTQRSMAQMTAMQAAICGHDVTLYAASDSNIIEFSQKISSDLGINSKINKLGTSIAIENMNGTTGYVHLKSCNTNSIGYTDPNEDKKHHQLFSQLKADNALNPYDIIHNHHRWFMQHAIIPSNLTYKTLTHQHTGKLENNYTELGSYPLICISKSQADILKASYNANVFDVVYHGLDAGAYKPTLKDAGYLAWIGRFLPEKGADTAITIAKELKT